MSKPKLNILISGGTGFIGSHLIPKLSEKGHTITVLTRSAKKSKDRNLTYLKWNGKEMPMGIGIYEVIINLAGASIAEGKWSESRKKMIMDSRISATQACVKYINSSPRKPQVFISASAVGYYGVKKGEEIDEKGKVGDDFAARVCAAWEAESQKAKCRTVNPRIGIVLGKDGGALKQLIPIYKYYLGGSLGSGRQGFPWIHIDDVVRGIIFCIENEDIAGAVNLVSPQVTEQRVFSKKLAKTLNRPDPFSAPKFALKLLLGERSLLLWGGQKAIPRVLQREKFTFKFSELDHALSELIS
ncbi:MAG: TIGR01777 family oxidoreductase [Bacteroidota bacterium]